MYRIGLLSALLVIPSGVQAAPTAEAKAEINQLLNFVEQSNCLFVRNGSEYPGKEARDHLESKLEYLEERDLVNSSEDFIERAASKSSISGRAYQVKCPEGTLNASAWLTTELQRLRQKP